MRRFNQLEDENAKLRKVVAHLSLDKEMLQDVLRRKACLASVIETAKLNGNDPLAYLSDILTRLAQGHPINGIAELLPWRWSAALSPV
jgi:hypothetical protein